ncbi:MAG: hypothetical protein IJ634_01350 [Bacteroidales bacterium]|nr:hypothetical protein [Bacteroidales bacterium]
MTDLPLCFALAAMPGNFVIDSARNGLYEIQPLRQASLRPWQLPAQRYGQMIDELTN